jgi:hypothetical protein
MVYGYIIPYCGVFAQSKNFGAKRPHTTIEELFMIRVVTRTAVVMEQLSKPWQQWERVVFYGPAPLPLKAMAH